MIESVDWLPSATLHDLRSRANLLALIRCFFTERGYLEVETPCLSAFGVTDVYLESMTVECLGRQYFLQTSPEYHMKRLLAAGSGPIFQIARAFRQDEKGRWHNPEFTMLEWYRPGITHLDMLQEIEALLSVVLKKNKLIVKTYQAVFLEICGVDPFNTTIIDLKNLLKAFHLDYVLSDEDDLDQYLFLLMSHVIEPRLAAEHHPVAVIDFPVSQAALAQIHKGVAQRFEVYYQGIELANGFHELTDAKEQRMRFELDNQKRLARGLQPRCLDERFLAAIQHGLPPATGVALGLDRLIALALNQQTIQSSVAFDISRA